MKTKLFLIIIIVFSWACSSKYDKESAETAPNDQIEMEEPASMDIADDEKTYAKNEVMSTETGRSRKDATTNYKGVLNDKHPEYLSDTLYLSNVRLSKKLILTADLRFKVESVEKATSAIEQLALKLGGYIHQSQITSDYVSSKSVEISSDSVLSITEYRVSNNMIIRVPNIYFDTVLSEIGKLHIYLDHREVKTEDVSTTFLRNKLKEEKRTEYEKRIQNAVDKAPRKLDDIVMAERTASDLADLAIDKKIENYQLQDRIDYSQIVLNMYQANTIRKEVVENTILSQYQPNFWQRAWKALKVGWQVILEIVIGLLYLWPLFILAIVVIYIIRYFRKKWKK